MQQAARALAFQQPFAFGCRLGRHRTRSCSNCGSSSGSWHRLKHGARSFDCAAKCERMPAEWLMRLRMILFSERGAESGRRTAAASPEDEAAAAATGAGAGAAAIVAGEAAGSSSATTGMSASPNSSSQSEITIATNQKEADDGEQNTPAICARFSALCGTQAVALFCH